MSLQAIDVSCPRCGGASVVLEKVYGDPVLPTGTVRAELFCLECGGTTTWHEELEGPA